MLLAGSLGSTPLMAAGFDDWNTDGSAGLTKQEYRAGLKDRGVFTRWDTNHDDMLTQTEFNAGLDVRGQDFDNRFGGDYFSNWDVNDDEMLSRDEFYAGTFAVYDIDGNNIIQEAELGDFGEDIEAGGFWDRDLEAGPTL